MRWNAIYGFGRRRMAPGLLLLAWVAHCHLPGEFESAEGPNAAPGISAPDSADEADALSAFAADWLTFGSGPRAAAGAAATEAEATPDRPAQPYGRSVWEKTDWRSGQSRTARPEASFSNREVPAAAQIGQTPSATRAAGATGPGIAVLCYHQVEAGSKTYGGFNVTPERFEEQLRYLKAEGYESLGQDQMIQIMTGLAQRGAAGIPARGVFLTFDDGLISHYRNVAPLLRKYGFRGTLFLYPSVLSSKKKSYMNWDQARELVESGLFEVGSHSVYHPFLPELSPAELERQMRDSKRKLETKLSTRIRTFAYPFGIYDRATIAAARAAGYELAFTINTGVVEPGQDRLILNRYMVTAGDNLDRFVSYLKLRGPDTMTLQPADGSHVRPGETVTLHLPDVRGDSVRVKLGGRKIELEQQGELFTGRLPEFGKSRGYLQLEVRAKSREGRSLFRRFLYLDAAKF